MNYLNNNKSARISHKAYDRIRVLGRGSFGVASVNRRRQDCSLVVLKEIDLSRFKGERERLSAINEATIMSSLDHANIIKYYNAYTTETKLIIEMEYASIGTLATYLSLHAPLGEREILVIFKQITNGLNYLHSMNIIHLDLKMENIFLTSEGYVKIGDFGIAHLLEPSSLNSSVASSDVDAAMVTTAQLNRNKPNHGDDVNTNSRVKRAQQQTSPLHCTLAFSSPERCHGEPTDFKSDIWSLGCILYELITSKPLFEANSLPQLVMNITKISYQPIRRNISPALRQTFESLIARNPMDRPTAHELYCITSHLLSQHNQSQRRLNYKTPSSNARHQRPTRGSSASQLHYSHPRHLHDISSEMAWRAESNGDDCNQLYYHHSLVYQVKLSSQNIQLDRVNLPQSKRIREMAKGKSHYLALTYDNIVFAWGSRDHGQLGACETSKPSPFENKPKDFNDCVNKSDEFTNKKTKDKTRLESSNNPYTKIMNCLKASKPTTRPFIINELNHRKIIQVAAGENYSVFLSKTGIVMTCGDGSQGCLGHGELVASFKPCMVESLLNHDVTYVASGPRHVVAVCGNGRVYAWGRNGHGRLGIGSSYSRSRLILKPHLVQFPVQVSIKRVYCGDKSTIFIDSRSRCWACGQNRFNKLGLDVNRRFKRRKFIEQAFVPQLIEQISKLDILSCQIAKNHTTFLTTEGKLLVFGQDIDHSFKIRTYINCNHRNLETHFLNEFYDRSHKHKQTTNNKLNPKTKPSCHENWSKSKSRLNTLHLDGKLQRQRWDGYIKECRATKIMPFENVLSMSCNRRFSLALTKDNRVYFWGTRSYKRADYLDRQGYDNFSSIAQTTPATCIEPQLVAKCSDECFVKIGPTNSSLMRSIQHLGSDQPIIHAQDPRLIANSLSDLWILDYQLACLPSNSTSSSIESLSTGLVDKQPVESARAHSSSISSCCSSCSCCSQCNSIISSDSGQDSTRYKSGDWEQIERPARDSMRHDAILDPQPIVSLYVPAMFNHQGSYLRLTNLFCFDEDRFYLILETTVKPQPKLQALSVMGQQSSQQVRTNHSQPVDKLSANIDQTLHDRRTNKNADQAAQANGAYGHRVTLRSKRSGSLPVGLVKSYEEPSRSKEVDQQMCDVANKVPRSAGQADRMLERESSAWNQEENSTEVTMNISFNDIESRGSQANDKHDNNNCSGDVSATNQTDNGGLIIIGSNRHNLGDHLDATNMVSSLGMSLEEPRSLSTFVTGPQIFTGSPLTPSSLEPLDLPNEKPVKKGGFLGRSTNRSRRSTLKSESTGNEETSSMPSWVKSEFVEYQQEKQQQQQQLQAVQHQTGPSNLNCEEDWIFQIDTSSNSGGKSRFSEVSCPSTYTTVAGGLVGLNRCTVDRNQPKSEISNFRSIRHDRDEVSTFRNSSKVGNSSAKEFRPRTKSAGESYLCSMRRIDSDEYLATNESHLQDGVQEFQSKSRNSSIIKQSSDNVKQLDGLDMSLASFMRLEGGPNLARSCAQLSSPSGSIQSGFEIDRSTNQYRQGSRQTSNRSYGFASRYNDDEFNNSRLRPSQSSSRLTSSRGDKIGSSMSLASLKKSLTRLFC